MCKEKIWAKIFVFVIYIFFVSVVEIVVAFIFVGVWSVIQLLPAECSECLCFSIFFVFVYANVSLLVFVIIIVIVFASIFTGRMERRPIITCSASRRRSCAFASLAPDSR